MTVIDDFLRSEIDLGTFPGAVYAVGGPDGIEYEGAVGHAVAVPLRVDAQIDTLYDCASLTKPLVTTTLVLQEIAAGRLSLEQKFHDYSVRELLTHTSGLRAWMPLYAFADPLETLLAQGPECERGTRVIYSDLNFILLWYAMRERYADFNALARERIFEPLGLSDATLDPTPLLRPRVAATEWGQRYEARMCAERKIECELRQGLIWGQTHDGNSWGVGHGCAGNAGLFATAREVFRITQAFINGELLPRNLAAEAIRNHTGGMDDGRGLGWQIGTGSAATEMLSPGSWGHTGFTGTSVWVDRDRQKILVLLANRVHPSAAPVPIQKARGDFHRLALAGS
jgi:CubicO group peptidase (beta-lactamase class C family)